MSYDILGRRKVIAVMDEHTCEVCKACHGSFMMTEEYFSMADMCHGLNGECRCVREDGTRNKKPGVALPTATSAGDLTQRQREAEANMRDENDEAGT